MQLPVSNYHRTVDNINAMAEAYKGGIGIVVNVIGESQPRRVERMRALFGRFPNVNIIPLASDTRAGAVQNDLVSPAILLKNPRLGGCARLAAHVQISWQGDLFMCCEDYAQEFTFGNIANESLEEILSGPIAADYRRQVYGLVEAGAGLLCRKCCHIRIP